MPTRWAVATCVLLPVAAFAEPLTLPAEQRPEWLRRDGIVMAGSWEPLLFRVRRDGSDGYAPTAEQKAAYEHEHSPEMVDQLKALGVNFVMMHCYKAFGPQAERESMADAARFSKLCRDAGLRVGVYNNSGTLGWELLFKELPQAKDWLVLDAAGQPIPYGRQAQYRYYWDRNHPDAQTFHKDIMRFAISEIRTDLIHFDNYLVGPGADANSVKRFREYLRRTFKPEQLRRGGIDDVDAVRPPLTGPPDNLLRRAWLDFSCRSLADSYPDLGRYARTLRKDILLECNPGGPSDRIRPPIDHGRLLPGGEAFWDEGERPAFRDGKLRTRIRTYKVARRMDNMAFAYTINPLEMAESMAFNLHCLGCLCWFEYGKLVALPGSKNPVSPDLAPFVQFFHARRDLLRDAAVVADVAVLRNFASQVFADPRYATMTARAEDAFIENRMPFQIIYDQQLDDLRRYRALVLAGCVAMSDGQVEHVRQYASSGGRLCILGPCATHDEWMTPRSEPGLNRLDSSSIVRVDEKGDLVAAARRSCDDELSMQVDAPLGLCAELTEQPRRRLVHLVNYRPDTPARDVPVTIQLPAGKKATAVTLASPEHSSDRPVTFRQEGDRVTFTVPEVRTYEISVIAME